MQTSHGHHIQGTPIEEDNPNVRKARCGGPGLCTQCSKEAAVHTANASLPDDPK